MGDKPIIRIAVPGDSAEEFMQNAAKQFRGDFFVAIDQAVGKFVRVEAPFLQGDVAVRGDAIAMPAVRNGRKGLVIRLVKLDPDSLGIPIPEASKQMEVEEPEETGEDEFDPQPTMASPVSAAVAKSIRATASASDRAPPVKLQPLPDELDDETREAVNEFGAVATRASDVSADLAKQLHDLEDKAPRATPATVRRTTPEGGVPKQDTPAGGVNANAKPVTKVEQDAADDSALDSAFGDGAAPEDQPAAKADESPRDNNAVDDDVVKDAVKDVDDEPDEPAKIEDEPPLAAASEKPAEKTPAKKSPAKTPSAPPQSRVQFLVMCLLLALVGAAAIALLKGWV